MSDNICKQCGGHTGNIFTRQLPAMDATGTPYPVGVVPSIKLCYGHPVQKHDGNLDRDDRMTVQFAHEKYVEVRDSESERGFPYGDSLLFDPAQALSLLAWLKQEEATLERLAKEQAG